MNYVRDYVKCVTLYGLIIRSFVYSDNCMNSKQETAPLNVLLADDDSDDCLFFGKALKELPIATNLISVQDGEDLMKYLSDNSENLPDILFLDLSMPRKTGFECLAEIKGNEKLKGLSVVVFTIAYPHNLDFEREITNTLTKMGAQEFIRKSADLTKLKQAIHHALILLTEKKPLNGRVETIL